MILILKFGTLITFVLTALACAQLWQYRRSRLTRLYAINLFIVMLWSFWVLLTLLSSDDGSKIIFTKLRQVSNPFLMPSWFLVFSMVFFREHWQRLRRFHFLLFVWPVITSLMTIFSLAGSRYFESLVAHSFTSMDPEIGLMSYVSGPVLRAQFLYAGFLMLAMASLFIFKIIFARGEQRKFAILFSITAVIQFLFDFFGSYLAKPVMIQMSMTTYIPMLAMLYYAIHRMEFLNLKATANQMAFENLPLPVLTMNPRGEIWDANKKAFEIFGLAAEDIGKSIAGDSRFTFIHEKMKSCKLAGSQYQVEMHEIKTSSDGDSAKVLSLTDVTEIHRLNSELESNNSELSALNSEIIKVTRFNRKIQTVLSHDLSGLLHAMSTSLASLVQKGTLEERDRTLAEAMFKTNRSSLELLKNILSWSYDEQPSEIQLEELIQRVLEAQSAVLREHHAEAKLEIIGAGAPIRTFPRMLEAVLRNLISNAIKHSPVDGVVRVQVFFGPSTYKIHISDQGKGIPVDVVEKIVSRTSVMNQDRFGFGIGIQFSLDFIRQMNGEIQFSTPADGGTRVELQFPRTFIC